MSEDHRPRCACGKLLAEAVTRPWTIRCPRCKVDNHAYAPVESSPAGPVEGRQGGRDSAPHIAHG